MIDEGGIVIWSGYKPHQHNLKWLAESECVGIWKTKIRTLILVDCRSVLLSFVSKTIVNIVLGQHRTENCVQKMSLRGKIKT